MNGFDVISSPLEGTNLIEASAGTGKTYAISIIFLRLIVEKNFIIEDILVVTFTIPATMELRLRIRERLRDAVSVIEGRAIEDATVKHLMENYKGDSIIRQRLLTAVKSFDQASVYTIHSFCQQMLADNAFESGALFSTEIDNDDALVKQGIADLCRRTLYEASPALVSYFLENCSAGELFELYKKRPVSPDLRIEPENSTDDIEALERCSALIIRYYRELCEAWISGEAAVTEIFYRENYLNGNKYRSDTKDSLIVMMNDYINNENPFGLFEKFVNFTSGKISTSLNKGKVYEDNVVFDICQKLYDAYEEYDDTGAMLIVTMQKRLFEVIDRMLLESKSVNKERSFDDLIRDAQRGLAGPSGNWLAGKVTGRYRAALIDEFQDTDNLQFDIFNRLFNNEKTILFLIGDPKQAIYRFRGADIFSYLKASQLMKNSYTMLHNWRSGPGLINAVNSVFEKCADPFVFDMIKFYKVSPGRADQGEEFTKNGSAIPPLDIWLADGDSEDPKGLLLEKLSAEISLLVNRNSDNPCRIGDKLISPGDIAVLVRTRKQGNEVRNALARYHIPSVSRGMDNVLKTDEAVSMYYIISAIAVPSNYSLVKGAVSTVIMGGDAGTLYGFTLGTDTGENGFDSVTSRFYDYRETWTAGGFLDMMTGFLERESVAARLFALDGGERMIANINHITEILHNAEQQNEFNPKELAAWFGKLIVSPPDSDEYEMRLERDDDAVNIITMHACKGLEFPVVYCPFLASSGERGEKYIIYHDPDDDYRPVIYLDKRIPDDIGAIKKTEDLAENARLFYVALTRAKSRCCVMLAPDRYFGGTAAYHIFVKSPGYAPDKYDRKILPGIFGELSKNSGGTISFNEGGSANGRIYTAEKHSAEKITVRKFTGVLRDGWKTHSYSSIVHRAASEEKHEEKDFISEYQARQDSGEGIFGFASGARAGLCIHEVFERTDFTSVDSASVDSICAEILEKYRYDTSLKIDLSSMFFNVVNTVLDRSTGLKLSDIGGGERLSELEFNFQMDSLDYGRFRDIFREGDDICGRIYKSISDGAAENGGIMKGFIDLVFMHNGKYYIADWKSNHLGNSCDDYTPDRLSTEMEKHNYYLQYYIYTAALNRYLAQRIGTGYSYEEHFGGIYYLFVRGMNPSDKNGAGIFRDRPPLYVIEKLDRFFAGETE